MHVMHDDDNRSARRPPIAPIRPPPTHAPTTAYEYSHGLRHSIPGPEVRAWNL